MRVLRRADPPAPLPGLRGHRVRPVLRRAEARPLPGCGAAHGVPVRSTRATHAPRVCEHEYEFVDEMRWHLDTVASAEGTAAKRRAACDLYRCIVVNRDHARRHPPLWDKIHEKLLEFMERHDFGHEFYAPLFGDLCAEEKTMD